MPQMSPIYWMNIYILSFIILLFCMGSVFYFFNFILFKKNKVNLKTLSLIKSWKNNW